MLNFRIIGLVLLATCAVGVLAEEAADNVQELDERTGLPVLTPEQLKNYQFENPVDWKKPEIEELSLGQQFVLDSGRQQMRDLIQQKLGVMSMQGDLTDLKVLQQVIDRDLLDKDDVKGWQNLGILFGDVLANQLDLSWVAYEDELGESKALRWKKTLNFVFPITMLSRRKQFNQDIDIQALYDKIEGEIEVFAEIERQLKNTYQPSREKSVLEVDP